MAERNCLLLLMISAIADMFANPQSGFWPSVSGAALGIATVFIVNSSIIVAKAKRKERSDRQAHEQARRQRKD